VELGERSWDDYKAQAEAGTHRVVAELIPNVEGPDDAVNIRFTSGTTGLPKGSTLSHLNILNNGYFVGRAMQLTEPGIR
jgi:fatty-acyl-CoA synthase